ncbi:macrophage mannose receptor 1-like [Triplophysa rosa]|uniref:macrophage mannose receptor 1-like n=1 Tax=Triplophysa rosa TaxID=992332 RepID=UPI0025460F4B|nr:macrophage mannose receptor 1-like [Triplophysa rosa]
MSFLAFGSLCECIQRQYYYINTTMNWTEAQSYCRETYTDLATINNMNDMNKLMKTVNNTRDVGVWIGLKKSSDYKWKWSLGDPANNTNWSNEQHGNDNCVFMRNGEWHHQNCDQRSKFICYNETSKINIKETSNKTWREAQTFCRQYHTDLTSVRNPNENEKIQTVINDTETSVWIGLFSDLWEWSDKSKSGFRNWKSFEPNNNHDYSEDCTEVRMNEGQWNDAGCHHSLTFVCHEDKLVLIKENLSWMEALIYCRKNHVDLVSVDTAEIEKRLKAVVQHASTAEVWLGLRHSCSVGIWFWVNGEIVCYEKWAEGNETAVENCETVMRSGAVQSKEDHHWISLPETERRNFICMQRM